MIFLRHPVTDAPPDFCYGQTDVGLGPEAEAQIAGAVAAIARPTAIRSSDLRRCAILADRLAERHGLDVVYDRRLREYDFGAWEGRFWTDIPRSESEPWLADLWGRAAPGGESFRAVHGRVAQALADCRPGTLIICHAGVIRAARMILQGLNFDQVMAEKVAFCQPIALGPARP